MQEYCACAVPSALWLLYQTPVASKRIHAATASHLMLIVIFYYFLGSWALQRGQVWQCWDCNGQLPFCSCSELPEGLGLMEAPRA